MNELFEEMKNDYEIFCRSAQRFMDACQEAQLVQEEPDYKSWVGKVVYVWDENPENKQKAVLLDCNPKLPYPFRIAGSSFKHAELCED